MTAIARIRPRSPRPTPAAKAAFTRFVARDDMAQAAATLDLMGGDRRARLARRLKFAEGLAERGRTSRALAVWRDTVDQLLVAREPRLAIGVCRRALRWAPYQTDWSLRLARILVTEGQLRAARGVLAGARNGARGFERTLVEGMLDRIGRRLTTGPLALVA